MKKIKNIIRLIVDGYKYLKENKKDIFFLTLLVLAVWGFIFPKLAIPAIGQITGLSQVQSKSIRIKPITEVEAKVDTIDADYEKLSQALSGTKMEESIPYILKASKYYELPVDIYLGFGFAESSFNRFNCFNPWGIDTGKGNDPRCYDSWEHSVNGFSQLIKYYYINEGKITPEQLLMKYVGWNNQDWVKNMKHYYNPEIIIKY